MHGVNLGLWRPYVHMDEMLSWYQLPPYVVQECTQYIPDGTELEPLTVTAYTLFHARLVDYVRRSVRPFSPAYHNDEMHFAATEVNGLQAADAYAERRPGTMPSAVRQTFGASLRMHDAHHCASTFRAKAPRGLYRPDLGVKVSSEWVTAFANDEFLRQEGWSLPARLFQFYLTYSSTYGGATPYGARMGIPTPQPTTIWGTLMRGADVCPPTSWEVWLRRTIAINYGEIPAVPPARTWTNWVIAEEHFCHYIKFCFDRIDHVAGFELTALVGWRKRLTLQRSWVEALKNSNTSVRKFAAAELRRYEVTLQA